LYVRVVYDYPALEKLWATLASYLGHFKWADSYRLQAGLFKHYGFLKRFFSVQTGRRIQALYKVPAKIPSLRLQERYFRTRFPTDVLLFQVGGYYEFFRGDDKDAGMLGLNKVTCRCGRKVQYGFPVRMEKPFVKKIMSAGKTVTVVGESDRYLTRIKELLPRYSLVQLV